MRKFTGFPIGCIRPHTLTNSRTVEAESLPHEKNSSQGRAASRRSLQGAFLAEAKSDAYGDLGAKAFLSVLVGVSG